MTKKEAKKLETAAANSFLADIKTLAEKAGAIEDEKIATAVREAAEAVISTTNTEGFWTQSKESMTRFWRRTKSGFQKLRDWVTEMVTFVVDGIVDTLKLVADFLLRIIDGIGRLITGTLELFLGEREVPAPQPV